MISVFSARFHEHSNRVSPRLAQNHVDTTVPNHWEVITAGSYSAFLFQSQCDYDRDYRPDNLDRTD